MKNRTESSEPKGPLASWLWALHLLSLLAICAIPFALAAAQ